MWLRGQAPLSVPVLSHSVVVWGYPWPFVSHLCRRPSTDHFEVTIDRASWVTLTLFYWGCDQTLAVQGYIPSSCSLLADKERCPVDCIEKACWVSGQPLLASIVDGRKLYSRFYPDHWQTSSSFTYEGNQRTPSVLAHTWRYSITHFADELVASSTAWCLLRY